MTNTGKYYISILIDDKQPLPEKVKFNQKTTIGLDMGLTHFLIISEGIKVDNPVHLKQKYINLNMDNGSYHVKRKVQRIAINNESNSQRFMNEYETYVRISSINLVNLLYVRTKQ